MSRDLTWDKPPTAESVSRLVNFSDAIVAIAVTLLVLPLVDLEPPTGDESLWDVMSENSGRFLAFGLSFVITLLYWRRHHRLFDGLQSFTPPLLALNGLWLILVVFLQFPTEMLGRSEAPGTATVYLLTLAAITLAGLAIQGYLYRHRDLVEEGRLPRADQAVWAIATAVLLFVLAVVSIWWPSTALYGLLALIPIGWAESAVLKRRPASPR
ncbi:MAG: TMEM175 family protein [Candidatus Nanopelagicales bacterium]